MSHDQDQRLYNPNTRTPGIDFVMTTYRQISSPNDIIISLPKRTVDEIFTGDTHIFLFPWRYFPPIPPSIRRVWIYEESPIQSITCVIRLDPISQRPTGLYQLVNPPSKETLWGRYGFRTGLIPIVAPMWLIRDYGRQVCRIW